MSQTIPQAACPRGDLATTVSECSSGPSLLPAAVSDDAFRQAAHAAYAQDGEIEFDITAAVSRSDEGAYVAAWVWVPIDDASPAQSATHTADAPQQHAINNDAPVA